MCFILNGWPGGQREGQGGGPHLSLRAAGEVDERARRKLKQGLCRDRCAEAGDCAPQNQVIRGRRRAAYFATLARFPQSFILHQRRVAFLCVAKMQNARLALAQAARVDGGERFAALEASGASKVLQ